MQILKKYQQVSSLQWNIPWFSWMIFLGYPPEEMPICKKYASRCSTRRGQRAGVPQCYFGFRQDELFRTGTAGGCFHDSENHDEIVIVNRRRNRFNNVSTMFLILLNSSALFSRFFWFFSTSVETKSIIFVKAITNLLKSDAYRKFTWSQPGLSCAAVRGQPPWISMDAIAAIPKECYPLVMSK